MVEKRSTQHRLLTNEESSIVKLVFAGQLTVEEVCIVQGFWINRLLPVPMMPMAPDGNIYFHPNDCNFRHDFCESGSSTEQTARLLHLFVHEMTHVWQHQRGCQVAWRGFLLHCRYQPLCILSRFFGKTVFFNRLAKKHDIYHYRSALQAKKLNIEQQAEVFADWFLLNYFPDSEFARQRVRSTATDLVEVARYREDLLAGKM